MSAIRKVREIILDMNSLMLSIDISKYHHNVNIVKCMCQYYEGLNQLASCTAIPIRGVISLILLYSKPNVFTILFLSGLSEDNSFSNCIISE